MALNWTQIAQTLVILFSFGALYALIVRWLACKHIENQTAYLVVGGVAATVLILTPITGWLNAILTLAGFAASGLPMVIEYVDRVSKASQRDRENAERVAKDLL